MKVFEIFRSISGEVGAFPQGVTATFVRFAGCNLRCSYCDAPEAQTTKDAYEMTPREIIGCINQTNCNHVVLTGGEPLTQNKDDFVQLLNYLNNKKVSIETNGTKFPVKPGAKNLSNVVDYKLSMARKMNWNAMIYLNKYDFIKFVVSSVRDIDKAISVQKTFTDHGCRAQFAYSPMIHHPYKEEENINLLASYILKQLSAGDLEGIINIQLHKYLGLA